MSTKLLLMFTIVCGETFGAAVNNVQAAAQPETTVTSVGNVIDKKDTQTHVIEINKFKFKTSILDVKVGDTVTWINTDIVPHTATAKDKSWDSGRLDTGESFSLTITVKTGTDYFCLYHRQMKAKLILTPNSNGKIK